MTLFEKNAYWRRDKAFAEASRLNSGLGGPRIQTWRQNPHQAFHSDEKPKNFRACAQRRFVPDRIGSDAYGYSRADHPDLGAPLWPA